MLHTLNTLNKSTECHRLSSQYNPSIKIEDGKLKRFLK